MTNKPSFAAVIHALPTNFRGRIRLVLAAVFAIVGYGCAGYIPGERAHWDEKIKALCESEGHVRIIVPVRLSRQQSRQMPRTEGQIALRMQINQPVDDPVYARIEKATYIRERDPEVLRTDIVAIQRSDQKVVARWVEYSRIGGDPLTGLAHQSSFYCPDARQVLHELQAMFVVED
jgi:hypothetical protein